jgi:Transposase DDE domain
VSRLPKLSLACDSATHLILSATASTGAGGDQPFFGELLYHARRRCNVMRCVVADAGYDSEDNHRTARLDLRVRSIIPPRSGRPTSKPPPPTQPLRRAMHHRFARKRDRALYGQRWQSETVNSMIKRNLGSALRARTTVHRRHELLLRVLTHNIMLLAEG